MEATKDPSDGPTPREGQRVDTEDFVNLRPGSFSKSFTQRSVNLSEQPLVGHTSR